MRKFFTLAAAGLLTFGGAAALPAQPAGACTISASCGGVIGTLAGGTIVPGPDGLYTFSGTFAGLIHGDPQASDAYITANLSGGVGSANVFVYDFLGQSYSVTATAQITVAGPISVLRLSRGGKPIGAITGVSGQGIGAIADATG